MHTKDNTRDIHEGKNTIEEELITLNSGKKHDNKNFDISCVIITNIATLTYKTNFFECIDSGYFYIKQNNAELENVDQILKLMSAPICKLIENKSYKIIKNEKIDATVLIEFENEYLPLIYVLELPKDNFTKEYTAITNDSENFKQMSLNMLNELTLLSQKIKTMPRYLYVNRTAFVDNMHWKYSPFDIVYNFRELHNYIGAKPKSLKKYFIHLLEEDDKENNDTHILKQYCSMTLQKNQGGQNSKQLMVQYYSSTIYYFPKYFIRCYSKTLETNSLKFKKEQNNLWFFEGLILIKLNNLPGSLLETENVQNPSTSGQYSAVSLKSLQDFLKINAVYCVGHVKTNMHLISDYFAIEYIYTPKPNNNQTPILMIHQMELKANKLYFKNIQKCEFLKYSHSFAINMYKFSRSPRFIEMPFKFFSAPNSSNAHIKIKFYAC